MFNATYFRYDGQWSGTYGLKIVDFDDNNVKETEAFSPTLSIQKVPGSLRFYHSGIEYDSAPACEFSVVSEQELTGDMRSAILSWLIGRKQFRPMQFEDGDNDEYTYYCVFTSAKTIWINGHCHGFRLTAQFDSPFARGKSTTVSVEGVDTFVVDIRNKSDIVDDYTYPIVSFKGGGVDIVNLSDDEDRHFTFSGLDENELVLVDNELKYISSSSGVSRLSNFTSKKWLRLIHGTNTLRIVSSGEVAITCPHYAMIGY